MPTPASSRATPAEYLALERQAEHKSEYLDGEIFAMTGASRRHNLICLNIGAELRAQLKQRPCEVYISDLRVKVTRPDSIPTRMLLSSVVDRASRTPKSIPS